MYFHSQKLQQETTACEQQAHSFSAGGDVQLSVSGEVSEALNPLFKVCKRHTKEKYRRSLLRRIVSQYQLKSGCVAVGWSCD